MMNETMRNAMNSYFKRIHDNIVAEHPEVCPSHSEDSAFSANRATLASKPISARDKFQIEAIAIIEGISGMPLSWSFGVTGALYDELVRPLAEASEEAHKALDVYGVARGAVGHSLRYRIGLLMEAK